MATYCIRADVEQIYGATNVANFADLDRDGSSVKIAARITAAIVTASAIVDDYGRATNYRIPYTTDAGAVPTTIIDVTARLTGLLLYEPLGADGFSPDGKANHKYYYQREMLNQFWADIHAGRRILDSVR